MKRLLTSIFPNGSSAEQRDQLRNIFFEKYGNPYTTDVKWPATIRRLEEEIWTLAMLDSCVVYHSYESFFEDDSYRGESYYDKYLRDYLKEGGTKKEFDKLLEIQKEHYKKSTILYGVEQDFEGCIYNCHVEPDEIMCA